MENEKMESSTDVLSDKQSTETDILPENTQPSPASQNPEDVTPCTSEQQPPQENPPGIQPQSDCDDQTSRQPTEEPDAGNSTESIINTSDLRLIPTISDNFEEKTPIQTTEALSGKDPRTTLSEEQNSSEQEQNSSQVDDQADQKPPVVVLSVSHSLEDSSEPAAKRQRTDEDFSDVKEMEREDRLEGDEGGTIDQVEQADLDLSQQPRPLCGAWQEFSKRNDNFLRGCKWAPDGTCLVTNSNDNCLRIFNTPEHLYKEDFQNIPEMTAALKMQEGELVYDYAWYPKMQSSDPDTCFLASSSRDHPIHMWDCHTGKLHCTYRAYDQMDELNSAHSLSFSPNGKRLYCGFNKMIRVFDVARPGRECVKRSTYEKQGQTGIISCIAVNPADQSLYAAGSYSRAIAVYSEPKGEMLCILNGQQGGVTHLAFSPDGNKLYSGGRKDPEILCWDIRNPGEILHIMKRRVITNQRIYFDQDWSGRYLVSGNDNGSVSVWDTERETFSMETGEDMLPPALMFNAHQDTVNGVSLSPSMPILATASGQRHFMGPSCVELSDSEGETDTSPDFSLRLWWMGGSLKSI